MKQNSKLISNHNQLLWALYAFGSFLSAGIGFFMWYSALDFTPLSAWVKLFLSLNLTAICFNQVMRFFKSLAKVIESRPAQESLVTDPSNQEE